MVPDGETYSYERDVALERDQGHQESIVQSNQAEWEKREAKGRERFLVPTYVLKDRFNQPGVPFLVAAYYIDAKGRPGVPLPRQKSGS